MTDGNTKADSVKTFEFANLSFIYDSVFTLIQK